MRIVAGEFRGRTIASPSEKTTRPTTDRVRESMFSSVYSRRPDLSETRALDAFAGSGALGLEALSRGAASCVFFEKDASARKVLQGNLDALGLSRARAEVRGADVLESARSALSGRGPAFGLVLLDPPYATDPSEVAAFLDRLAGHGDLEPGCVAVYEYAAKNAREVASALEPYVSLMLTGQKKYGKIGVVYLKFSPAEKE